MLHNLSKSHKPEKILALLHVQRHPEFQPCQVPKPAKYLRMFTGTKMKNLTCLKPDTCLSALVH